MSAKPLVQAGALAPIAAIPGSATALAERAGALALQFRGLQVTNRLALQSAADELRTVKGLQKQLEELRTSVTGPLNQALSTINDWFRTPKGKLAEAEEALKGAIGEFEASERRRIAEEERLARERARQEQEELERRAAKAAEQGRAEKAAELAQRAAAVTPATPDIAPVKAAGVSFGEHWDFTVVDESQVPREYLMLDLVKIRQVVKAMKGSAKIPGIAVSMKPQIGARSAR